MANSLTKDPIILDTQGTISLAHLLNIFKAVKWSNPTTVGHRAKLVDKNGDVVCDFTCAVAKETSQLEFGDLGKTFDSPLTLTLDSGTLYLYKV